VPGLELAQGTAMPFSSRLSLLVRDLARCDMPDLAAAL
jgi:hypothetical protein